VTTHAPELIYTAWTAIFTGVLWIPIIVNRLLEMGMWKALSNPEPDVRPHANWAYRLASAHRNAIENLVVFAPLAIAVSQLGLGTPATATASGVFFGSRVVHAVIYTAGVPFFRTVVFLAGFVCQVFLALRVLGYN
jgi:uncharacterized MAPEG superfamily protein